MRATILLKTNPGYQQKAYATVKSLFAKSDPVKGVEIETIAHCMGRWDGIVSVRCSDIMSLNAMTEKLRQDGVFHTETLISIE